MMNHGWDDRDRQERAGRAESERYGATPIEPDADILRRDRIRRLEHLRAINQSPWMIGVSHWNQRDLYTRNNHVEDDGYGHGPALHPAEGSYAYHRDPHPPERVPRELNGVSLHEREAWPLLNYTTPQEDPYFAHLDHERRHRHDSFWERLKEGVAELLHSERSGVHLGRGPKNAERPDARIREDVCDALTYRGDLDATDIDVTVHAGEVTLEGTVTDRRSKHIAEQLCESVAGVRDVHNKLTIRKDDPSDANVAFVLPLALLGG